MEPLAPHTPRVSPLSGIMEVILTDPALDLSFGSSASNRNAMITAVSNSKVDGLGLKVGMVLLAVNGVAVLNRKFNDIMEVINVSPTPKKLLFFVKKD